MALGKPSGQSQTRVWKCILLPLILWLLLVLMLYGIETHLRWMEKTRLNFNVTLVGQPLYGATASLDGKPVMSGQKITLGSHTLVVTHPKGELYSTNFSIHYGGLDLGTIDLKRATGTLSLAVDPPADMLDVRGPEWSVTLTNCPGLTNMLPTDVYEIEAEYPHWQRKYTTTVFDSQTTPFNIAPHFGGLQLDCNQSDATFQLQTADGQIVTEGMLPVTVTGLPAGEYQLRATHHGHGRTESATVTANTTNDAQCDFQYGAAVIETSPAGVAVLTQNGRNLGETPLTLIEMLPGTRTFTLQRAGYQSVQVSLDVTANQTNFVSTNLISETYFHALTKGRQYMADADYDHALLAAGDALAAKPGDVTATTLQNEASGLGHLQRAKVLAYTNDYIAGGKELALALQALPDNEEIKGLIASYKQQEPAQVEQERVERLARPKKVFDDYLTKTKDSELFDSHELTTSKPVKDVAAAIENGLEHVQPTFKVSGDSSPEPETYVIYANQIDANIITTSGRRQCLIVCGQSRDDETQIYFKVMEYKAKHNVSMAGLLAIKNDMQFIPINPSRIPDMTDKLKAQVLAGVSNLTVRIEGAIGQTPATPPATPQ
jgi:hypothetical protein